MKRAAIITALRKLAVLLALGACSGCNYTWWDNRGNLHITSDPARSYERPYDPDVPAPFLEP